ncbi:hypothetical protein [Curtobacterium sp. MCSS17_007]|uniref:hypothetical protein n=1 Tax=Curtobacterium sp. MCSS17_007 TaxID=2175646 RepID=UPI000DA87F4E|nr:hypothetical protein [Curtobacterium sp. MCSS17_007]WIE74464.1 hypothetical protein DEJ22_009230 [Curtobacterium sp. MCSS17_007]
MDTDASEERTEWARVDTLLAMRRTIGDDGPVDPGLFGVPDKRSLRMLLELFLRIAPDSPSVQAFRTAFHFGHLNEEADVNEALMDRRESVAKRFGVSVRTVQRLERSGAALIDEYFRRFMSEGGVRWLADVSFFAISWAAEEGDRRGIEASIDAHVAASYVRRAMQRLDEGPATPSNESESDQD